MPVIDSASGSTGSGRVPRGKDTLLSGTEGCFMMDNRGRIVAANLTAKQTLLQPGESLRLCQEFIRNTFELRYPATDKIAARILIGCLPGR
jgi:hypothetical protein